MTPFTHARAAMAALVIVAIIAACSLVTGCGSTTGLSAEQIKAMEGQSSSVCVRAPGWNGSPLEVHYVTFGGKATGTAGGGGKATCGTSVAEFNNEGRAPTAAPAPAAAVGAPASKAPATVVFTIPQ